MRIRRFLLGKWRGIVTTAPIALTIIYNGSNQTLVSAGQGTGNMLYKLNNGSWSYDRPQALNVNTYTVYYKAEENKKYKESGIGSVTAAIAKVTPTVTAPTPETLTYNTQAQSLISAGSTNWGTLKYSLDNKIYSTSIPTATDAGNYKVYYRVDGDSNIEDVAAAYVDVTISPKVVSSPTITLGTNSYVYNGQEKKPTVSSVKDGNVTIASTEYTVSYTDNINAGTATCVITDKEGGNYTVSGTKTYTINKADTTYTAPIAKTLTYTGESQELLSAGTVSGGVIKYSSNNSTWGDTIPSQTTAGTYTSYWKIVGDSNHNDKASASIETTIAKKALNASVSITGWNYGNTANSPSVSGNDGNGTVTYNYKLSSAADSTYSATVPTNAGNYTVRAVIATTTNYLGTTVTTTFTIAKVDVTYTAPTIKTNLVYNGSAQDLLNAGTVTGGTMKYSKDEVTWSTSIPQSTNAALYTSYWRIDGDSNHNDYSGGMLSTRISKATGAATISSVTSDYTGSAQVMISVSGNTGTMHYRVGTDGTWQDTKPTRTLVGSDTIYYYMDTSANYFAQGSKSEPWGSVTSTINKATRSGFAVSMANWTYGTTASDPSVSNNYENGTVTYSYKVNGAADSTYTSTKPSDVGTYVIKAVAAETDNYKESTATTTFSIIKLDPSYTAPTAKSLTYSGSALSLLNAGSTNDGTIQYSSDGSTWNTTIPTATNAGSHNTYWRLVGDAQHKDIASTKIVVTIGKKSISPSVSMSGWTYGGTASSPSVSGNDGSGTVTYKYKVSGAADSTYTTTKPSNAGTYVVWASIAETSNYQSGSATKTFTISKANISPSVSMGGWTYGGTASSPSVSGNTGGGGVTYAYKTSGASDSTYSSTKPSNAGTYTVRASINSTTNYNSATCTTNFTISKANPAYSAPTAKSGLSYSGSSQTLYNAGSNTTAGSFSYTNGTRTNAGTQTVSWSFTPTDTTNYNSKSGSFDVTIAKASRGGSISLGSNNIIVGSSTTVQISSYSGVGDGTISYSTNNNNITISGTTVNGVSAGTSIITGFITEGTNYTSASYTITITIYEYVEINGVKWATMNVGASSVTDSGLYFLWGDTQGYSASQVGSESGQKYFGLADYKYGNGESSTDTYQVTKYTGGYNDNNFIDDKTELSLSDDGARAYWGDRWRMPTADEMLSLRDRTLREWVDDYQGSGVSGCLIKQYTDLSKYIFLPARGSASYGTCSPSSPMARIWSKSLYLYGCKYACETWIRNKNDNPNNYYDFNDSTYRTIGLPIRAVYDDHILPAEYTELEYISSTSGGNQYINLGIKLYETLNTDYDIAMKFNIASGNANQAAIFACQDSDNDPWPGTFVRVNTSNSKVIGRYIGGTAKDNTLGNIGADIELPVQTSPNKNVTSLNNNNSTHQYGTSLFCAFVGGTNTPARYCNAKLYYFKLFVGGTLVRDLIPCKNSNNVVGMYDVVNDVFYTSPNGNAFVAGPMV